MTNRKAAYVDFSQERYKSLSDDEVKMLKQLNTKGDRTQLRTCEKHGLYTPVYFTFYDENSKKSKIVGCEKCINNFGKNDDK